MVEAAQHGVPTVGYRSAGGLRESIIDGETGVLVDSDTQFKQVVRELISEPEALEDLGDRARAWSARFSWEETGRKFAELIEGLVAG